MSSQDAQSEAFINSDTANDEFFIEIVENKLKINRDKFKLRLVLLSPATGKNENFASVVYRAKIKIEMIETQEKESVDVILKVLLTTNEEIKKFSVFPRERYFYENVLSSFEKIWEERADEKIKFGPKSIKFETDPYEIIVLDDLKAEGYKMLDRKVGLDFEQSKLLLAKLAKFHAASAVRYQKDGVIHSHFDRKASMPLMSKDSPIVSGFISLINSFIESVKNYGDCDEYVEKISGWNRCNISEMFLDIAAPMRNGFVVLNHGDAWMNNMMFMIDESGKPADVLMIDYQGSFWGGPSVDLLYFIISSVNDDIKTEKFDDFVEFYHQELSESLKKLEYDQPIPTLGQIHIDLLDKGFFACCCLMFILFTVKYDSAEEITIQDILSGANEEIIKRIYNNDYYKKAVKIWLKFLNKRGFLDTL